MLYDISPTVRPETPVWPGDTPFQARLAWSIAEGASVNVTAITCTPHLGAHADAPFHTEPRGEGIAEMPIERYLGPCRLVKVPAAPQIEPRHVEGLDLASPRRLLFRSDSVRDRHGFPERFTALSPELAALLAERGVLLVGMDTPWVNPLDRRERLPHRPRPRAGVAIL